MNPKITFEDESSEDFDVIHFRRYVGKLLWLARCTRPDILFAVIVLTQFQAAPKMEHYGMVKHIVRYLHGTAELTLKLNAQPDEDFRCYVDASYADTLLQCRSASGMVCMYRGSPVAFRSTKQNSTVLSSCDAELIGITDGMKHIAWLHRLITEIHTRIGQRFQDMIKVHTDSASALALVRDGATTRSNFKHVEVRMHWIIEQFHKREFELKWTSGKDNVADIFTKGMKSVAAFVKAQDRILPPSQH